MVVQKRTKVSDEYVTSLWGWALLSGCLIPIYLIAYLLTIMSPAQFFANPLLIPGVILATANTLILFTHRGTRSDRMFMIVFVAIVFAPLVSYAVAETSRARGYLDYVRIQ